MNRKVAVILGLVLLCTAVSTVVACEGKGEAEGMGMKGEMMGKGMMGERMMGKGGMMCKGMMGMCPMHEMMESMAEPVLVATRDGGVVVLLGGRLYKYDRHLNLKEETELKVGMGDMHRMMMQMGEKCPMMKKMMGEGGMMEGGGMMGKGGMMRKKDKPLPAEAETPEEGAKHEKHH